jgi:hypothetical protein
MNVLAADDLEAAGLLALARLALARLDDDGATDMIAAASGHARQQLTPARAGVA